MASKEWKTVSVRLNEAELNALMLLCRNRDQKKHAIVKEVLLKELDPIMKPGALPEGKGIPLIGQHLFKYNPEKDTYTWQLDLGVQGIHILGENISSHFLINLHRAVESGLQEHEIIEEKIPKNKTRVPKDMLKFEVK